MVTSRVPRVVLLERNSGLRDILAEALGDLGFEVSSGSSRWEALELLLENPDPDLLVLDLVDEASGGRALLAFLAEQPETARIPVVIMTEGAAPRGERARGVSLVKPFGIEELLAATHQAMSGVAPPPHPGERHDPAA